MAKGKGGMLRIFIVFLIIEVALVILSGNFSRQIQVVNEEGQFELTHAPVHFDLQAKISEEFQHDKYVADEGHPLEIYGSEGLYNFFAKLSEKFTIFGDPTPIGTFRLLRMLLIVDLVLLTIGFLVFRALKTRPSQPQILFELLYSMFDGFVEESLGKKLIKFTPYVFTIFLFLIVCNMIGMIPIPGFMEPTRNLNVPLGLGLMVVFVVHVTAIAVKGPVGYLKDYMTPLMPLDVIGEAAKGVSIAFRLFGNILGGAIIILVVSSLVKFVLLPIGLNLFFGMFVGAVQAFVFTMLALSYISVAISD
ncbi:MAG: F0F1 ATP synthase subunit A [Candidatus Cloacimonetes bacterium]|nr:F0F1 ATP synthase subunit A [Candidatus Cloacimonadota bacterium]